MEWRSWTREQKCQHPILLGTKLSGYRYRAYFSSKTVRNFAVCRSKAKRGQVQRVVRRRQPFRAKKEQDDALVVDHEIMDGVGI